MGLQNLCVGGAPRGGEAGSGAMGQGAHSTSFLLEAARVAHTLALLELPIYLGQFGGGHLWPSVTTSGSTSDELWVTLGVGVHSYLGWLLSC